MGLRIKNIGTTYVSNYQRLAALWDGGASMVLQRTVEKRKRDFLRTMFLFETEKKKKTKIIYFPLIHQPGSVSFESEKKKKISVSWNEMFLQE